MIACGSSVLICAVGVQAGSRSGSGSAVLRRPQVGRGLATRAKPRLHQRPQVGEEPSRLLAREHPFGDLLERRDQRVGRGGGEDVPGLPAPALRVAPRHHGLEVQADVGEPGVLRVTQEVPLVEVVHGVGVAGLRPVVERLHPLGEVLDRNLGRVMLQGLALRKDLELAKDRRTEVMMKLEEVDVRAEFEELKRELGIS
jgi:hypothetical protein